MKILVLGAGAIGGLLGAHLGAAGLDVTFLVRPRRAAALARDGLTVRSPAGQFSVAAPAVASAAITAPFDAVLVACKAYDLADAVRSIAPAVGPGTIIVPFLNGIRQLDVLSAAFPAARLAGALVHLSAVLGTDGVIEQSSPHALVRVGSLGPAPGSDGDGPALQSLVAAWRARGLDAGMSDRIGADMWAKYVFLATFASATCLMRATLGEITAVDGGRDLVAGLLAECERVAEASAARLEAGDLAHYRELLLAPGTPLKASMARDIERAGRTECEHVLGDMADRARAYAIATPLLDTALLHLRIYEATRRQETLT